MRQESVEDVLAGIERTGQRLQRVGRDARRGVRPATRGLEPLQVELLGRDAQALASRIWQGDVQQSEIRRVVDEARSLAATTRRRRRARPPAPTPAMPPREETSVNQDQGIREIREVSPEVAQRRYERPQERLDVESEGRRREQEQERRARWASGEPTPAMRQAVRRVEHLKALMAGRWTAGAVEANAWEIDRAVGLKAAQDAATDAVRAALVPLIESAEREFAAALKARDAAIGR